MSKSILSIGDEQITSVDQLLNKIHDMQYRHEFGETFNFKIIEEYKTNEFDGMITELTPLGEKRVEIVVMYHYNDYIEGYDIKEEHVRVRVIEDIDYPNICRGFKRIIIDGD